MDENPLDFCRVVVAAYADSLSILGYARVEGRTVEYLGGTSEQERYLDQIALWPHSRGLGAGRHLLDHLLAEARSVSMLTSLWAVRGSKKFFSKCGFHDALPPHYPSEEHPSDACFMRAGGGYAGGSVASCG